MEQLLGIVAAAAGVAETEAAELATTDEGIASLKKKISDKDAAKVLEIRKDANGRVLKIATAAFTKLGVDPTVFEEGREFKENLAAAAEALQSSALESAGKGTLTDEEVLKLPAVKKLRSDILAEADRKVETAKKEASESLTKERQEFRREQVEAKSLKYVREQIAEMNPDFGTNATIAANRQRDLEQRLLKELPWDADGETVRLVDAEGEVLRDASHNVVQPADKVREIVTSYYELPISTHKDPSGISQTDVNRNQQTQLTHYKGELPKTEADYVALANDPNLKSEALKEVQGYWKEHGGK